MDSHGDIDCAQVMQALDLVIWVGDSKSNRIQLDGPVDRLLGWAPAQRTLTLQALIDHLHPADRDAFKTSFDRHVAGESASFSCEFRLRRGDGSYRWMMDRGQILKRGADGSPEIITGIWVDIHDRKVAELLAYASNAQAQALNTLLREAIDSLPEGIVIYDDQDRLTLWNTAVEDLYGEYLDGSMQGRTFEDIMLAEARRGLHPDAVGRERAWVDALLARRRSGDSEEEMQLGDGRRIRAQDKLLKNGYRVGLRIDVTQLVLQRERLMAILDGANLATWEWDAVSGGATVNDRWYDLFEADRAIRGVALSEWFRERLAPEDLSRLDAAVLAHFRGETDGIDIQLKAPTVNGTPLVFLLRGRGMQRLPDGRYRKLAGVMIDVTALQAATQYLERARRDATAESAAKTELLSRLNHEIRTPLNAVLGTLSVLEARFSAEAEEEQQALIALASESGSQLTSLLDELLDLGRMDPPVPAGLSVIHPELIADMVRARHQAEAQARGLVLDVLYNATARRTGRGDPRRITRILDHLVGNAIQHAATGTVEVRLRVPEHGTLLIEVLDEGPGIPAAIRERLFEPLGQPLGNARQVDDGQGLGLAFVQRLVASLDGHIGIDDRPGGGTRVRVRLPLALEEDEGLAADGAAALPPLAGLRVLAAEDLAEGRLLLERMLARLGAEAMVVEDGYAALSAIKQGRFDVALVDIRMPGIDGMETLHLVRLWEAETQRPRLPMVAMSASAMADDRDRYREAGFLSVLAKPIRLQTLGEALERFVPVQDQDGSRP